MDHTSLRVNPAPDAAEAAAIVAALEALWPQPAEMAPPDPPRSAWKFSNRWWSQPRPLRRRARPWS